MKDVLKSSLYYDFYGELLTKRQREIYEDFMLNDFSLGEIAADRGISRQGVYDTVKRCEKTLEGYESRLHLVEKFINVKRDVREICGLADCCSSENMEKIKKIANDLLENY